MRNILKTTVVSVAGAGIMALATPAAAADQLVPTSGTSLMAQLPIVFETGFAENAVQLDRDDDRRYRRNNRRSNRDRRDRRASRDRREIRSWRGRDGRTYCEKEDGTTGLLIGAVVGGLAGREVARDRTLGAVIGAAVGGLAGREIDRADPACR